MARLARFERFIQDTAGNGLGSVSVEIRKQGATVNGNQSGTSPLTITVNDPGAITSSDSVVVNTGTTSFAVDSVTTTTVVVSGFGGTLAVNDDDRISPATNLPSLFNDALSVEALSNPLTSDTTGQIGRVNAWVVGGFYDVKISGGGSVTALQEDTYLFGENNVSNAFDSATQDGWIWDSAALTTSGAVHTSFKVNGSEVFSIDKDGKLPAHSVLDTLTIDSGGITVTAGGITVTADGLTVTDGGAIIDAKFVIGHTAQVAFGEVTSETQVLGTTETDASVGIGLFNTTNTLAPILKLMKSANATVGSFTRVADDEELGKIQFYGDDGVDYDTLIAEIACNVDDPSPSAGAIAGELVFKTSLTGGQLTTAVTMDNIQRVGISVDPVAKLDVNSSNSSSDEPVLRLTQSDIDDSFVDYVGTSAADGSRSISSDTTEDSAKFGAIMCEINGVAKWIRVYDTHS